VVQCALTEVLHFVFGAQPEDGRDFLEGGRRRRG
jgi:hypothetical protein